MIPPEPSPTVPEYTYGSSRSVTLGAVTGTLYTAIQYNGQTCALVDNSSHQYNGIILYDDVVGDPQCYFVRGTVTLTGILGSNAEIGQTVPVYTISNGSVSQSGTEYLSSSNPSDYFENIRTRNFTLVQRS